MSRVFIGVALAFLLGLAVRNAISGSTDDFVIASIAFVAGCMGLALTFRRADRQAPGDADVSGWRAIGRELSRARRMERSFSLARITPADDVDVAGREPLLRTFNGSIRDIDAGWWLGDDILIMLSETSADSIGPLMKRLQAAVPSVQFAWSVAEFPRDGLTLPALLGALTVDQATAAAQLEVSDGAL
jgi:hypothetical protein